MGVEGVDRFMVPPGRMLLRARSSMSLLDLIDRSEPRIEPPENKGREINDISNFGSLVLYKLSACTEECRFIGTEVREKRRAFLLRHVPHGFPFAPFNIWRKFSLAEECLCFLQLEYPTFLVERK